jgi:MSHA biogenesis protein MshN
MSLVNDMLNDLDARRSQHESEKVNLDWMSGQKTTHKNKWLMPLLIVAIIIMFLLMGYSLWQHQKSSNVDAVDKLTALDQPLSSVVVDKNDEANVNAHETIAESSEEIFTAQPLQPVRPVDDNDLLSPHTPPVILTEKIDIPLNKYPRAVIASEPVIENKQIKKDTANSGPKIDVVKNNTSPVKIERQLPFSQQDKNMSRAAEKLFKQQRFFEAEKNLSTFVQENPQSFYSAKSLSFLWLSQKKYDQAQVLINSLRIKKPLDIDLLTMQARLYFSNNDLDKSVDLLMSVNPSIKSHIDYYELLGLVARQNKQYELSAQTYRGLLDYDISRGDWWVGMAIAFDLQGEVDLAREAYRKGVETRRISLPLKNYAKQRLASL